jgi:hypothetical protein
VSIYSGVVVESGQDVSNVGVEVAPGEFYAPTLQAPNPYIAPASYNVVDQIASPSLRGQLQQKQHDPRMTALSPLVKGLQRGFICQDPNQGKGFEGKGLRRFSFLFNPSTLPVSYGSNGEIVADNADATSAGTNLPAINAEGGVTVSLSLLLDRTYETWSNRQSRGVMEDIHQLEKMCGWSERNPWLQVAAFCHLFLGPYQHWYGVIQSFDVTYTNWTQYLVPNRASVDLNLKIYPWSGDFSQTSTASLAGDSTAQGHTLAPGDSAAATQTYNEQVPKGSTTGEVSDNGWAASKNAAAIGVSPHIVAGPGFKVSISNVAAPLLLWAARRWHEHVEPIHDIGGYNYRPNVNNPSVLSNHSSGTAIDINASAHPNNTDPTSNFSGPQIAYIRDNIIAPAGGALRWGGDYHSTKDGMHIEINVPPGQAVAAIASTPGVFDL